jgi:hypothetical protein
MRGIQTAFLARWQICRVRLRATPPMKWEERCGKADAGAPALQAIQAEARRTTLSVDGSDDLVVEDLKIPGAKAIRLSSPASKVVQVRTLLEQIYVFRDLELIALNG